MEYFMCARFRISPIAYYVSLALMLVATASHAATDELTTELAPMQVTADAEKKTEGNAEQGYRNHTATVGPLGRKLLEDVPYSISVTHSALIENLHANRPTEALRYDPMVNPEMGSNRNGDYFSIRGFINSSNQALDGMRSSVAAGGWLEDKERVEVLSGAPSFLYGIASPAGMVNYVLKRPTPTAMRSITLGDYGGEQAFAHVDMGGPLDNGGRFAYRLNVLGVNDGDTGVDKESQARSLFSTAFDWHLGQDTLLSLDAAHYHSKLENLQAYFFVNNITKVPDAPDASKNYSAPYSIAEQDYDTQGISLSSKLSDQISIRAALRHGHVDLRYSGVRDRFVSNAGTYTQEMYYYRAPNVTTEDRGNLFADFAFKTGPLAHTVTAGYIGNWVTIDSAGTSTYNFPTTNIISLTDPTFQANPNVSTSNASYTTGKTQQNNFLFADEIRFSERWSILAGANRTSLHDDNFSSSNGSLTSSYGKQAITPSLALTYKPGSGVMVYASYIEALEEGTTAPTTVVNSGEVLAPFLSTQHELGAKLTLGELDLKAALFRIERASAYTDPVSKIYAADGRERHQGGEFSFSGKLSPQLTLLGGFSVISAKLTKTSGGTLDGKMPQAVPKTQARLYGEYALPAVPGLVLSAGLSHTGAMWADDQNTKSLPSVTTGDIGLRYVASPAGYKTTYRISISNITNENYWTSKGGSMIYLGSPRIFAASATLEF